MQVLQLGASHVGVGALVVDGTLVGVAALMGGTFGVIPLGPSLSCSPSPQLFYFLFHFQFSHLK